MVGRCLKLVDEGLEVYGFGRSLSLQLWSHSSQFRAVENGFLFCSGSIDFATEPHDLIDIVGGNDSSSSRFGFARSSWYVCLSVLSLLSSVS